MTQAVFFSFLKLDISTCCLLQKQGSWNRSITKRSVSIPFTGGSCNQKIRLQKTAEMASHVTCDEELASRWGQPQNHRRLFQQQIPMSKNYISLSVLWSSIFASLHTEKHAICKHMLYRPFVHPRVSKVLLIFSCFFLWVLLRQEFGVHYHLVGEQVEKPVKSWLPLSMAPAKWAPDPIRSRGP